MGQVMNFRIRTGQISAKVQGSMREPYSITITVKTMPEELKSKMVGIMASKALYAAKMLSGEMPEEIEGVLSAESIKIFPPKNEFLPACTCPDSAVPCKHIAAVCYIIAEELDRNPFLLFKLRGMDKEELLERLGDARRKISSSSSPISTKVQVPEPLKDPAKLKIVKESPKKQKEKIERFWQTPNFSSLSYSMEKPTVNAALIKRLGEPRFWRQQANFVEFMEGVYEKVSDAMVRSMSAQTKSADIGKQTMPHASKNP